MMMRFRKEAIKNSLYDRTLVVGEVKQTIDMSKIKPGRRLVSPANNGFRTA